MTFLNLIATLISSVTQSVNFREILHFFNRSYIVVNNQTVYFKFERNSFDFLNRTQRRFKETHSSAYCAAFMEATGGPCVYTTKTSHDGQGITEMSETFR